MSYLNFIPLLIVNLKAEISSYSSLYPCFLIHTVPSHPRPYQESAEFPGCVDSLQLVFIYAMDRALSCNSPTSLKAPCTQRTVQKASWLARMVWEHTLKHHMPSMAQCVAVTSDTQRIIGENWLISLPLQDKAWDVLRTGYLREFGLSHQSAHPFQIHFPPISNTIILITTSCWWVLTKMPGIDLLLCIHFVN